ncbi:MAG TPA: response regulator [Ktedonobacterales bacterium]|nr:response regulator [Ktedonobacterales bacterium]
MSQVLVVDDDRAIRELLRYALEAEGYAVTLYCDGRGVVEALAAALEPCVVLMDMMMPEMSGWDVCRALEEQPELMQRHGLALMSAGLMPGQEYPSVADVLMRKPFRLEQVYTLVEAMFAGLADRAAEQMIVPVLTCDSHMLGSVA